ncbi:hypothetical protein [Sphingomonas glacialis]|uniref:Secreted protein n=1 Tax=Sphingomonas glacialis TaxID=658225 RepID=A0A502FWY8_9SPHN|nr:hypothetical protein [Sphingomonas glacialis]TPG53994.1 hypothetical protein EAH76_04605 [Sphingomonas glacialis]
MKRLTTLAALWIGATATVAAQAAPTDLPCLTEQEGQSLVRVVLPDVLDAVGKACASTLPPTATLRAGLPALVARYRMDGDSAWNAAKPAIGKLGGEQLRGMDPDVIRPLVSSLLGPLVVKDLKPGDCPRIDRITGLLAPLPVANTAALVVQLFLLGSDSSKKRAPFTICPTHG